MAQRDKPFAILVNKERALERGRTTGRPKLVVGVIAAIMLAILVIHLFAGKSIESGSETTDPKWQPELPETLKVPPPPTSEKATATPKPIVDAQPPPKAGLQNLSANRSDWLQAKPSEREAAVNRVLDYMRAKGCSVRHSTASYVRAVTNLYADRSTSSIRVPEAIALIATGTDDWQGC